MFLAEEEIQFGCSGVDLICMAFEAQARGLGDFVGWLAEIVLGSQELAPGTTLWDSAIAETSWWFAIAILVSVGIGIIGVSTGALSLSPKKVGWSLLGILSGIPATMLALTMGGALLSWSDDVSDAVIKRFGGEDGFANLFRAVAQNGTGSDAAGLANAIITSGTGMAIPVILMLLLLIVGLLVISFALAFRNLGIMVLIAFAPLAFMAVGMKGGWQIVRKWVFAFIALLISKPLMLGVIAMMLATSDGIALFSPQTLTVVMGLFVSAFMPMMAYSFFNFLGAQAENNAGAGVGSEAGRKAKAGAARVGGMAVKAIPVAGGAAAGAGAARGAAKAPAGGGSKPDSKPSSEKEKSSKPGGNDSAGQTPKPSTGSKPGGNAPAGNGQQPQVPTPPTPQPGQTPPGSPPPPSAAPPAAAPGAAPKAPPAPKAW